MMDTSLERSIIIMSKLSSRSVFEENPDRMQKGRGGGGKSGVV